MAHAYGEVMGMGIARGKAERTGVMAARPVERVGPNMDATDEALVEGARRGDDRAFEVLFERYHRRILAYVGGLIGDRGRAEDVTQEIFISALARIRVTQSRIEFRPWIHQIARNACIDEFRRPSRKREVSLDAGGETLDAAERSRFAAAGLSPVAAADQRQTLRDLLGAFESLSDTNHRALVLRELGGLSYQEIAKEMGISQSAVESTLFRARRRLGKEYEDLASGQTCARVERMTGAAARGRLDSRDQRQFARHVAHCSACRVRARFAGVEESLLARDRRRRGVRDALAGILPLPAFVRDRLSGGAQAAASGSAGGPGQAFISHWPSLAPIAEPLMAGWGKAAVVATAVAATTIGGGVGVQAMRDDPPAAKRPPAAVAPAAGGASSAGSPGGRPAARGLTGAARVVRRAPTASLGNVAAAPPPERRPSPSEQPGAGFPSGPGGAGRVPTVFDPEVTPPRTPRAQIPNEPQVEVPKPPTPPKTPTTRETPKVPELPAVPKAPEAPNVPDPPKAPGIPEAPSTPDLPEAPSTPDLPEVPRIPDLPEVPSTPDLPEVPALPRVP